MTVNILFSINEILKGEVSGIRQRFNGVSTDGTNRADQLFEGGA